MERWKKCVSPRYGVSHGTTISVMSDPPKPISEHPLCGTSADANTCPIVVAESAPVEVLPRERAMVTTHRRCGGACACSSDRCGGSANEATCVTCGATNKTCSGSEAAAPVADDSWTKKETPCAPNVADTKTEVERVGGQYFLSPLHIQRLQLINTL